MIKILFDRIDEPGLNTLEVYERRGGYRVIRTWLYATPNSPSPGRSRTAS